MDIPFKVVFQQSINKYEHEEVPILNFKHSIKELYAMLDEEIDTVTENLDLSILFTSEDEEARFYMDGLDIISVNLLEIDTEEKAYLSPSPTPLYIFKNELKKDKKNEEENSDENLGYYPLIPGYYRIKVVANGEIYYSWLKVEPKQINEGQWVSMREEVEDTLHGLAQDLIRKNAGLEVDTDLPIPIQKLHKLYILKKDFTKWITSLRHIKNHPRMRLKKEYNLVPRENAKYLDAVSIRYLARHPESKNQVYSPYRVQNYNLLENQWIKWIMRFITREINDLQSYLKNHKNQVEKELKELKKHKSISPMHIQFRSKEKVLEELNGYEKFISRVRSECISLLSTDWIEEVDEKQPVTVSHVMRLDPSYRQIYKLYRELKSKDLSLDLEKNYDYYWKRTDLLYEIWGFIQVVKGLQNESVGFEVEKGWIFNIDTQSESLELPFLEPGTLIDFKKDNIKLRLVYDGSLPYNRKETKKDHPLYANYTNNRPDARIDLYEDEVYIGTIVLDFKYRPIWHIWNDKKLNPRYRIDTMRQLISYRENLKSVYLFQGKINAWHQYNPIHEVWAVYPKHINNYKPKNPMEEYQIRLMELTPLDNKQLFYDGLSEAIQKVLNFYHDEILRNNNFKAQQ